MKKWFSSKESKKITMIVLILCAVLFVQTLGFIRLDKNLYYMSLEHLTNQVNELSVYVEKNFQAELDQYIDILEIAQVEAELEADTFSKNVLTKLQDIQAFANFQMTGVSNLNGIGIDATGSPHNILYKDLYEKIKRGQVYISNILKSEGETVIFIAVPLKMENKVSGILWGKVVLQDIVNGINLPDDSDRYFQIIDDKGNYLLASESKFLLHNNSKFHEQNIWKELENYEYADGMSAQKVYDSVQRGEKGNFYFEDNGEGHYVNYRPLQVNNWYLFSLQAEDTLHTYVNHTRKITTNVFILLFLGVLGVLVAVYRLMYTMYKNITKQHYEIQAINAMLQVTLQKTNNTPFMIERKTKQVILYGCPTKDVVQYRSFADMHPEYLLEKGVIDETQLDAYKKLYNALIIKGRKCDPVILYACVNNQKEWIRVSIISDVENNFEPIIGVLEGYNEQKQKDIQIESHLDDIKKIEKKSQTDFLTKLYNRETFIEKLEIALKENSIQQQMGAFLILDLDYFKEVNDCLGHSMGDIVLQETAQILQNFFRKEDIVGRLGGDEFIIFAQNIKNISAFEQRIAQLNTQLCKTYCKNGKSIQISASIGILLTDAQDITFYAVYEKADQALYQVKQAGRNGYQFYVP